MAKSARDFIHAVSKGTTLTNASSDLGTGSGVFALYAMLNYHCGQLLFSKLMRYNCKTSRHRAQLPLYQNQHLLYGLRA